jgi:cbb3-type cytochrome oxidase cytochrome c subunit
MNYGPLIFLAAFFALSASWFGFVLTPQIQIGRQQQEVDMANKSQLYPQNRPGLARQGLEVYRAEGCAACHSQQVGQTGTACNVILMETGTNRPAVADVLKSTGQSDPGKFLSGLAHVVLEGTDLAQAESVVRALKDAGAKATLQVAPVGPDITRGWGRRRTVAADYLFDAPVMLGSQRVGPDLANVGLRLPDANLLLRHLYAPQSVTKDSLMPPYRFLFEKRKIGRYPSPDALHFDDPAFAPPAGYEIVPKPEALALVAYLMSLHADAPLFEAPMSVAPAAASSTNTNSPAK